MNIHLHTVVQRGLRHGLHLSLCLCLGWLISCRETPLPDEIVGEPVFFVQAELDAGPLSLTAGMDGYFLDTRFEQDTSEVYSFVGHFYRPDCQNCGEELIISIRDFQQVLSGQAVKIEQALQPGMYSYREAEATEDVFEVRFQPQSPPVSGHSYQWDFGDGTSSTESAPLHVYRDTALIAPEVCLNSQDPSGCSSSLCNRLVLDTTCRVDFAYQLDASQGYVRFESIALGADPIQYRWDFGDGFRASLGNPGYFYAQPGVYEVCHQITDANGCRAQICKNVASDPSLCEGNFTYSVKQSSLVDPYQYSQVSIQWMSEEGLLYQSAAAEQGAESYFEILASETYDPNRRGEATRKLEIRFRCQLFNDQGELLMREGEGVIAVAYPD